MLINFIHTLFRVYYFLIIARILLSWAPTMKYNEWVRIIEKLTDPYLNLFKRIIPPIGMIDISPIAAIMVLGFIENIAIRILFNILL